MRFTDKSVKKEQFNKLKTAGIRPVMSKDNYLVDSKYSRKGNNLQCFTTSLNHLNHNNTDITTLFYQIQCNNRCYIFTNVLECREFRNLTSSPRRHSTSESSLGPDFSYRSKIQQIHLKNIKPHCIL